MGRPVVAGRYEKRMTDSPMDFEVILFSYNNNRPRAACPSRFNAVDREGEKRSYSVFENRMGMR